MARLRSQEKLGYFKTPIEIVNILKEKIKIKSDIKALDPCCGTGEALHLLTEGTKARTIGIELSEKRYPDAEKVLHKTYKADAIEDITISANSVDLLFLNPPYDFDTMDKRAELSFLKKYIHSLSREGILIFIVPKSLLNYLNNSREKEYLLGTLKQIDIFKFTEEEYKAFEQYIIVGQKSSSYSESLRHNDNINKLINFSEKLKFITYCDNNEELKEKVQEITEMPIIEVDKYSKRLFIKNESYDFEKVAEVSSKKSSDFLREKFNKQKEVLEKPLTELKEAHTTLLLLSGHLNGRLEGNKNLLIKGNIQKRTKTANSVTDTHYIRTTTDSFKFSIRMLNIKTGEMTLVS